MPLPPILNNLHMESWTEETIGSGTKPKSFQCVYLMNKDGVTLHLVASSTTSIQDCWDQMVAVVTGDITL